ncbi:MAG: hypothetical protein CMH35_03740 [Microbacterium sp.]|nr:hypothetical protein [Planctomycetota bacterium]MAM53952.1 hypothetical protein [Microbacterium sp.]|tara:strand:- start:115 stop:588 length:474 start_codon:yes stop_codon:yes gene_type:complete
MTDQDLRKRAQQLLVEDATRLPVSPPSPQPSGGATNWRTMQDQQARDEWQALRDWVEWVTTRYDISASLIPDCWWKHGALVEELSALHCAHRVAFNPTDSGNGPVTWHQHFANALPRLRSAYNGGCNAGHSPRRRRSWTDVTNEEEWESWTNQSHAH